MREHHISGLPRPKARRRDLTRAPTTADLVNREFSRDGPNLLWMTDITEHPTREGKLYCCAVLDAWSRKVVGWSLDRRHTAAMVNSALAMALHSRGPRPGAVVHSDHGWSIHIMDVQPTDPLRRARPVAGHCRRRIRQCCGRVLLGTHANRTPQHQKMEDPRRALHRDLRLDRSVLQSPAAPLGPREHRTRRIRATPPTTTQSRLTPTTTVQQAGDTSRGLKSGPHLNPPRLSVRGEKRPRPRCLWCGSVSSIFSRVCAGASFTAGAVRAGLRSRVMVAGCPG